MRYTFEVKGTARNEQTWETKGTIESEDHDFFVLCNLVGRECFEQLTQGRATYGKPGLGCQGPYQITKFSWERKIDA